MAQAGWLSIRNFPVVKPPDGTSESQVYYNRLQRFFAGHALCPVCFGDGSIPQSERPQRDTVIKFRGIAELEIIHHRGSVPMSYIIRDILSRELEGRETCERCGGQRFIAKKRKTKSKGKDPCQKKRPLDAKAPNDESSSQTSGISSAKTKPTKKS